VWDTYVHIRAGWVYVAFIVDAYSPPEPGFGTIYGRLLMDICVRSRRTGAWLSRKAPGAPRFRCAPGGPGPGSP
jgi:hypothetical protein